MIDLAVFAYRAFLHFDKITDFCFFLEDRARTNSRERSDIAIFTDYRIFDHGIGGDICSFTYAAVFQYAVWADLYIAGYVYIAFKNNVYIYLNVFGNDYFAPYIETN